MRYLVAALLLVLTLQATSAAVIQRPVLGHQVVQSTTFARQTNLINRIGMNSPLSGSVLVAQALRSGRIRLPYRPFYNSFPYALTCSPTPCRLPNVQASGGGQPVNETPVAADPNHLSHLLTGGNDYNCSNTQGFYASINGGSTWNHTCFGNIPGTGGVGDPDVGYDTAGNTFAAGIDQVSGSTAEIAIEKSTNFGQTWSAPGVASTGIGVYTFTDKDWLQIDDSTISPWVNWLYISTTDFDPSSNSIIAVGHSADGGATWTNVQVDAVAYPTVDQFSDLAISAKGIVYVSWMRCSATGVNSNCGGTKAALMISRSADGGNTWSKPVTMATPTLAPDPCGAFYGCLPNTSERVSDIPVIDVDRSGGPNRNHICAAYYDTVGNNTLRVRVVESSNSGRTWSAPVNVSGARNDEFFPWLTISKTGVVGVTWLDRRRDPSNVNYDAFAALSTDGCKSFGANVRISTASSNPFNDGFGGSFMGDYTGNIWDGKSLFQSWTDTRTGTGQDEIGGYKI